MIDATAGNGHDTLLMAELVGDSGYVYAFDNQPQAIDSARAHLSRCGLDSRVSWCGHGHEQMARYLPPPLHGRIKAVVFNLGYLPGGDKSHITRHQTTLPALAQACELLMPGGMVSIMAYTGHPGGREETEAIKHWTAGLLDFTCELTVPAGQRRNAPEWLLIHKNLAKPAGSGG